MITTINRAIAQKREEGEKGFTLIELLVVILIIGVLAAIAIPAFLNQREGAWKSQAQSDLKNAAIAAEQYAVDHNGTYAGLLDTDTAATTELADYGFNATADVATTVVVSADGKSFVLTANYANLATDYIYDSQTGVITP